MGFVRLGNVLPRKDRWVRWPHVRMKVHFATVSGIGCFSTVRESQKKLWL
jgi:hypothetical protein